MRAVFDVADKKKRIEKIEQEMQAQDFWQDIKSSQAASEELSHLKDDVAETDKILTDISGIEEMLNLAEEDERGEEILKEIEKDVGGVENAILKEEGKMYFSGPYDKNNAILTIYSGAGGLDAQDWAGMLLRMYEKYAEKEGYKVSLIARSFGEEKGIKEAVLGIEGKYAYGYLKNENGAHRLVRISPYSAQKLRHTSFALVEVLPQLPKESEKELDIRTEDLEISTFRASGPGGQYVNKTESAVRIKHIPTGIIVESQAGRLQGQNKETAMKLLRSKLFAIYAKREKEKIEKLRGVFISAEWGSQIRSYVLHPYKMVKDHRTGVETSDAEGVLDGNLKDFIQAGARQITNNK